MRIDWRLKTLQVLTIASIVSACGRNQKDSDDEAIVLAEVKDKSSERFNLARYVRENPKITSLKSAVGSSDAYLFFGEKGKFRAETNLLVEGKGEEGFFGSQRAVTAAYWLDGYVFSRRVGIDGRGSILDLGAVADLATTSLEAHVRFLGQDKYSGKVGKNLDQSFTRDLNLETVYYPVPFLGVKVGGNIGGEVGLKAEIGVRNDQMMTVLFKPKTSISAGLAGGIQALKFASAEIGGLVKMLDLSIAATANLGYIPANQFAYGHIGVDGGEISGIDGEVFILAKAGVAGLLPADIDQALWKRVLKRIGIEKTSWEWQHTVWDPKPLLERDVPSFGTSFSRMGKEPYSLGDCKFVTEEIDKVLGEHVDLLTAYSQDLKDIEAQMATASLGYLADIRDKNLKLCK